MNAIRLKKCSQCEKEFETRHEQQMFCSFKCIKENKNRHYVSPKVCKQCNKEYEGKPNQKYCSNECRTEANSKERDLTKICKQCNEEFITIYESKLYCSEKCKTAFNKTAFKKPITLKNCKYCNEEFEAKGRQIYCSSACKSRKPKHTLTCEYCKEKFIGAKINQRFCSKKCSSEARLYDKICIECHKEFKTHYKKTKYCSAECVAESQRKIVKKICKGCNEEFVPKDVRFSTYCSRSCFMKHAGHVKREMITCSICNYQYKDNKKRKHCPNCKKREEFENENKARLEELEAEREKIKKQLEAIEANLKNKQYASIIKACPICNGFFKSYNPQHTFCSDECRKKQENRKKELRKGKRAEKIRSNGEIDHDITLEKLIIRDKNICHICNTECDITDFEINENDAFITGVYYPSIDHITAINNGGTHTWDNVKLAHFHCNTVKSDKEDFLNKAEQLTFF